MDKERNSATLKSPMTSQYKPLPKMISKMSPKNLPLLSFEKPSAKVTPPKNSNSLPGRKMVHPSVLSPIPPSSVPLSKISPNGTLNQLDENIKYSNINERLPQITSKNLFDSKSYTMDVSTTDISNNIVPEPIYDKYPPKWSVISYTGLMRKIYESMEGGHASFKTKENLSLIRDDGIELNISFDIYANMYISGSKNMDNEEIKNIKTDKKIVTVEDLSEISELFYLISDDYEKYDDFITGEDFYDDLLDYLLKQLPPHDRDRYDEYHESRIDHKSRQDEIASQKKIKAKKIKLLREAKEYLTKVDNTGDIKIYYDVHTKSLITKDKINKIANLYANRHKQKEDFFENVYDNIGKSKKLIFDEKDFWYIADSAPYRSDNYISLDGIIFDYLVEKIIKRENAQDINVDDYINNMANDINYSLD